MTAWRISSLADARLPQAWPLVHLRYPGWTMETWLAEARTLLAEDPPAGVLVAETDTGYIYAVCGYQLDLPEHGSAELVVRVIANVSWRGPADPLAPLLHAVETQARDHGCNCARVDGGTVAAAGETGHWEALGYHWMGTDLRKDLGPAAAFEPRFGAAR